MQQGQPRGLLSTILSTLLLCPFNTTFDIITASWAIVPYSIVP